MKNFKEILTETAKPIDDSIGKKIFGSNFISVTKPDEKSKGVVFTIKQMILPSDIKGVEKLGYKLVMINTANDNKLYAGFEKK